MKRASALVLAAVTTAATLAPTAAQADTYFGKDATHDVISQTLESDVSTPEPARADGDILWTAVNHLRHRVIVRTRYVDLKKTSTIAGHSFLFRTNEGIAREVDVIASPAGQGGRHAMMTKAGNGKRVRCHTTSSIDYVAKQVTLSVPSRCLSNPRWVQVGMGAFSLEGTTADNVKFYADDAVRQGEIRDNLAFGPRVFR